MTAGALQAWCHPAMWATWHCMCMHIVRRLCAIMLLTNESVNAWTVSKHWSNVVSAFVMFFLLVVESVDKKWNWYMISHIWRCDVVSSCLSWLRYESVLLPRVSCYVLIWFDLMSCPAECNFSVESTTKPWSPDDKPCGPKQENVETTFAVKIENTSNRFFVRIVYLTFWQISKFNVQNETASPSVDFVSRLTKTSIVLCYPFSLMPEIYLQYISCVLCICGKIIVNITCDSVSYVFCSGLLVSCLLALIVWKICGLISVKFV